MASLQASIWCLQRLFYTHPMTYFYIDASGATCGPIAESEFAVHGVTLDTPLWCEGMADWARARNIPTVKAYLEATTSPEETTPVAVATTDSTAVEDEACDTLPAEAPATDEYCGEIGAESTQTETDDDTNVLEGEIKQETPILTMDPPEETDGTPMQTASPPVPPLPLAVPASPPLEHSTTTAPAMSPLRNSWEATQRVDLMESLDIWKWLNIALVFFAVLAMCFSLTWIAIPLGIIGAIKANNALRYAELHSAETLQKALNQSRLFFAIGCLLFVAGIVGQIVLSAIMTLLP